MLFQTPKCALCLFFLIEYTKHRRAGTTHGGAKGSAGNQFILDFGDLDTSPIGQHIFKDIIHTPGYAGKITAAQCCNNPFSIRAAGFKDAKNFVLKVKWFA